MSSEPIKNKLCVKYSTRYKDLGVSYPLGIGTRSDGRYISEVFNEEFVEEMTKRGYDIKTLKFIISTQQGNPKFASEQKK